MSGGNGGVPCRPWIGRVREGKARPMAAAGDLRVSACAGSRLVCAYFAQAPPPGGNGGGAAASGNAEGDDRYSVGMGVPAMDENGLSKSVNCLVTCAFGGSCGIL